MSVELKANVTEDLVVVLPGIMGSTLYQGDRLVWGGTPETALTALVTRLKGIMPRDGPSPDYCDEVWQAISSRASGLSPVCGLSSTATARC